MSPAKGPVKAWAGGGGGARQVVAGRKKRPRERERARGENSRGNQKSRKSCQGRMHRLIYTCLGFWEGDAAGAAAVTRDRDEENGKERETRKGRFFFLFLTLF